MPDDKSGREKQAKRRDQRQRRRELEEAIKRLDEPEPSDMDAVTEMDDSVDIETMIDNDTLTDTGIESEDLADDRLLATDGSAPTVASPLIDALRAGEPAAETSDPMPLADPTRVPLTHLIGKELTLLNAAGDDRITHGKEPSEDSDR